jgi:hypothetical protein
VKKRNKTPLLAFNVVGRYSKHKNTAERDDTMQIFITFFIMLIVALFVVMSVPMSPEDIATEQNKTIKHPESDL